MERRDAPLDRRDDEYAAIAIAVANAANLSYTSVLRSALREYARVHRRKSLLTVEFAPSTSTSKRLRLCLEALDMCRSLGLAYLAAAVSDFYVPKGCRSTHKIQSRDYGIESLPSSLPSSSSSAAVAASAEMDVAAGRAEEESGRWSDGGEGGGGGGARDAMRINPDGTLLLTLHPVPKAIPALRCLWCPEAFVVSFKLEMDPAILRVKSMFAMEKSGVHLVVGNVLSTRYERVFVMSRSREFDGEEGDVVVSDPTEGDRGTTMTTTAGLEDPPPGGDGFRVREIAADGTGGSDDLESATIEYVTTRHFFTSPPTRAPAAAPPPQPIKSVRLPPKSPPVGPSRQGPCTRIDWTAIAGDCDEIC
jgi:hypothetical protein